MIDFSSILIRNTQTEIEIQNNKSSKDIKNINKAIMLNTEQKHICFYNFLIFIKIIGCKPLEQFFDRN